MGCGASSAASAQPAPRPGSTVNAKVSSAPVADDVAVKDVQLRDGKPTAGAYMPPDGAPPAAPPSQGSRPVSAQPPAPPQPHSRPTSAQPAVQPSQGSRPASAQPVAPPPQGSRPTSAKPTTPQQQGSRPASAASAAPLPQGSSRPVSAQAAAAPPQGSRPASQQGAQPASGDPVRLPEASAESPAEPDMPAAVEAAGEPAEPPAAPRVSASGRSTDGEEARRARFESMDSKGSNVVFERPPIVSLTSSRSLNRSIGVRRRTSDAGSQASKQPPTIPEEEDDEPDLLKEKFERDKENNPLLRKSTATGVISARNSEKSLKSSKRVSVGWALGEDEGEGGARGGDETDREDVDPDEHMEAERVASIMVPREEKAAPVQPGAPPPQAQEAEA